MTNHSQDPEFMARRAKSRQEVNALDNQPDSVERNEFFRAVYDRAGEDAAQVPWADLAAKPQLLEWLANHPGRGKTALDIACGLGDNAEAIAAQGYDTIGFDISPKAIEWAKKRFPDTQVDYQAADLFNPPPQWISNFDLVNECYTLQALSPQLFEKTAQAIANLVKPGGTLLVYTRTRPQDIEVQGPPFPLSFEQTHIFEKLGFELTALKEFELVRPDKTIPHRFMEWQKA